MFRVNNFILVYLHDEEHEAMNGLISYDPEDQEICELIEEICNDNNLTAEIEYELDGIELDCFEFVWFNETGFHVHNEYALDAKFFERMIKMYTNDDSDDDECDGDCVNCPYTINVATNNDKDFDSDKITLEAFENLLKKYNIGGRHDC